MTSAAEDKALPDILVTVVIGGGLVALGMYLKQALDDRELNQRLAIAFAQARLMLPPDSLNDLTSALKELRGASDLMFLQGATTRQASRAAKEAALRTVLGFIELERIMPEPVEFDEPTIEPLRAQVRPIPPSLASPDPEFQRKRAELQQRLDAFPKRD